MSSHKQGEYTFNMLDEILEGETLDEQMMADETTITAKAKKTYTPFSNRQKDLVDQNKQTFQSIPKFSPLIQQNGRTTSVSSYTKAEKKINYGVPSSPTHSSYSRSYTSPEITLREEVKNLKRLLLEQDDMLREREAELLDAEDIVEALQERIREVESRNRELQRENEIIRNYISEEHVREVESRNRELQRENEIMRNYIDEKEKEENEKKKSPVNELTKIISSMMKEFRGESGETATLESTRSKVEDNLQKENEFTNNIVENNEPTGLLNSVLYNIQRIRGESILPISISNNIQRVRAFPNLISNNVRTVRCPILTPPKNYNNDNTKNDNVNGDNSR